MSRQRFQLRISLPILRAIESRHDARNVSWNEGVLRFDLDVVDSTCKQFSTEGYEARVQRLARRVGLPSVHVSVLESMWQRELDANESVSWSRLLELAAQCACVSSVAQGPLAEWRQVVESRLWQRYPNKAFVEHFDARMPVNERANTLELGPVLHDWPTRIWTHNDWKYAKSPFEAIPAMPLDDVWVDIHFFELQRDEPTKGRTSFHELRPTASLDLRYRQRHSFAVAPVFALEGFHGFVVLIGEPGSGKTTFLKWAARQLLGNPQGRNVLPLFVPLRNYVLARSADTLVQHALAQCGVRGQEQQELWENAINYLSGPARENVVFLLDGWDEVPLDRRESLVYEIRALAESFTVVVTSRPSAYPTQLAAEQYYEITELSPENISRLIDRWHTSAGDVGLTDRLHQHLDRYPDVRRLARNPFLLTVLCAVSWARDDGDAGQLPVTRTELYRQAVERIEKTHTRRFPQHAFTPERHRQVERLAYWLLAWAPDAPRYIFESTDVPAKCGGSELVEHVLKPSRLLNQWDLDEETLYFIHATFQEYFAAGAVAALNPKEVSRLLNRHMHDRTWQEVFCFVSGSSAPIRQQLWKALAKVASNPDRFGLVYTRVARFLREAGVQDGGIELIKLDAREKLWERICDGLEAEYFISSCSELDSQWYLSRCTAFLESVRQQPGPTSSLFFDLTYSLARMRTPESSAQLVKQLLTEGRAGAYASFASPGLTTQGLKTLREELQDPSLPHVVRRQITSALGMAKDYRSIAALEQIAGTVDELRGDAIDAIQTIGGTQAFTTLDHLLSLATTDKRRRQIILAMGKMKEPQARDRLLELLSVCPSVDDPLATIILFALDGNPINKDTETVVDFLRNSKLPETREFAAKSLLLATGTGIADALAGAVRKDGCQAVRSAALGAFVRHGRPSDRAWLTEVVHDASQSFQQRSYALEALIEIASRYGAGTDGRFLVQEVTALVRDIFNGDDANDKTVAAEFCYKLGRQITVDLVRLCERDDESPDVLEAACLSLQELRHDEATDVLLRLQSRTEPERLAVAAATALTCVNPTALCHENTPAATKALANFSVATGCLVFDDHILDRSGRPLSDVTRNRSPRWDCLALGLDCYEQTGSKWWTFHRHKDRWRQGRRVSVRSKFQKKLLCLLARNSGFISRREAVCEYAGMTSISKEDEQSIFNKSVKAHISRLRQFICRSFEVEVSADPLPWSSDRADPGYCAAVEIGYAVPLPTSGNRLTFKLHRDLRDG